MLFTQLNSYTSLKKFPSHSRFNSPFIFRLLFVKVIHSHFPFCHGFITFLSSYLFIYLDNPKFLFSLFILYLYKYHFSLFLTQKPNCGDKLLDLIVVSFCNMIYLFQKCRKFHIIQRYMYLFFFGTIFDNFIYFTIL